MEFIHIILNEDVSHECIRDIGRIGMVQFIDLNEHLTPFQRRYVSGVKRCDELERKVRYFTSEIDKFGLTVKPASGSPVEFLDRPPDGAVGRSPGALLSELENELEHHERQLLELNKFHEKLTREFNEKVEFHEVLSKSKDFYDAVPFDTLTLSTQGNPLAASTPLLEEDFGLIHDGRPGPNGGGGGGGRDDHEMRFSSVTGVLAEVERSRFEKTLFRATRGNCYVRFAEVGAPMTDPVSNKAELKTVFIVFYKSRAIEAKVRKICDAFGARRYSVPDSTGQEGPRAVEQALRSNGRDLGDARVVLVKNREARLVLCKELSHLVQPWLWTIVREKAVFHTLNSLKPDVSGMLRAEGWVVAEAVGEVRTLVEAAHTGAGLGGACVVERQPTPWPTPPTNFKLNSFTKPYQDFVDTYGVPRYKEANPALFTAVTFPFLFGIMYGDIGHGSALALGGAYLCASYVDDPKRGEMMEGIYQARYMILMMGCFAVYAGLLYNDLFSLPLTLFTSAYKWPNGEETEEEEPAELKCKYGDSGCVYAFGVDPAWHISGNELLFFNSMKMKMSVILGIIQMGVGVFLKGLNATYFKQPMDLYLEVLPMMAFAYGMFGYMIVLIFVKWSIDWDERMYMATCNEDNKLYPKCLTQSYSVGELCKNGKDGIEFGGESNGCEPPNLITTLINIALAPGSVDQPMYAGQSQVQTVILLVAFLSVPVLLLGKPIAIKMAMNKQARKEAGGGGPKRARNGGGLALYGDDDSTADAGGGASTAGGGSHGGDAHGGEDEHGDFTEIVIHQAIETIEFVLGMVSNTASYLRLWALSLAHTELASVFWEKAMLASIETKNPLFIFIGYAVFAVVTFAVLLCMDVLECFLHALRLHWVEFQNKFYKADGYKFAPFDLAPLLRNAGSTAK